MKRLGQFIPPITIVAIWSLVNSLGLVDSFFLPGPLKVVTTLKSLILSGVIFNDWLYTVYRSLLGFTISALLGIPIGIFIGRNRLIYSMTQPTIDFFRSIPATALFPLFLFFFGIGDMAKVAIVVYACLLIVVINTALGASQVKNKRIQSIRLLGASTIDTFRIVIIPESMPGILAGLRLALSLSFVLVVVAEMFGGTNHGLGHFIVNSQMVYKIPDMYAGILLTGLTGYIFNIVLIKAENKLLHWVGE